MTLSQLIQKIDTFPDFPVAGVMFKDISPLLADAQAFTTLIDFLVKKVSHLDFDVLVGIDARGFIFGAALAQKLHKGFVMARKANKLPGELLTESFAYEYSETSLTIQKSRIKQEEKYLIVDDVLATGNTASAVAKLITNGGGSCAGILVFLELLALHGRQRILDQTALRIEQIQALVEIL